MNTSHRRLRASTILVVVLLVVVVVFLLKHEMKQRSDTSSVPTTNDMVHITDERLQITKEDAVSSIAVAYPHMTGFSDSGVEAKINTAVKTEAQSLVDSFLSNYLEDTPPDAPGKNSIVAGYTIAGPVRGYITVLMDVSEFASGAAHPNPYAVALTFNISTGKKVTVADFFKPGSAYLNVLSSQSRTMVTEKLGADGDAEWIATGTAADELNFQVVYPDTDGFHVIFNAYQVAPYVVGATEIVIPYNTLTSVLK